MSHPLRLSASLLQARNLTESATTGAMLVKLERPWIEQTFVQADGQASENRVPEAAFAQDAGTIVAAPAFLISRLSVPAGTDCLGSTGRCGAGEQSVPASACRVLVLDV